MNSLFGVQMDTLAVTLTAVLAIALAAVAIMSVREWVFFRLGTRNFGRRKGRTALIVFGLMLGTVLISASLSTGDTLSHSIRSSVLSSLGTVDEIVTVEGTDTGELGFLERTDLQYFDESATAVVREALAGSQLVDGIAPAIIEDVAVQDSTSRQSEPRVTLFAADPALMAGFGEIRRVVGGAATLGELAAGEVYLNDEAANELDASAGDQLLVFAGAGISQVEVRDVVEYDGTGTDGPALLMPLGAAQEALARAGLVNHVLISNAGGATSGAKHSDDVIATVEPALTALGLEAAPAKQDALAVADELGSAFVSIFATFGTFSIIAGFLLIFLIFVMLAAERRTEMGIARAIGTQRGNLIQTFLFEGVAYAVLAAAVGALLGVGVAFVMVFIMIRAFETFGVDLQHDVRLRSLVVAYTFGVLLTALVVAVSAWRVSSLNIVAAIRDIPEAGVRAGRRRRWLIAGGLAGLGALLALAGLQGGQTTPWMLGTSLLVISLIPILQGAGGSDRFGYTLASALLVVWWLLPFDALDFILPEMTSDISIFILSGVMVVAGATWAVMYNSDLILRGIMAVFGRVRWLAPILKAAIAYPLMSRFRTGVTLALFTLVVFTLVVVATVSNAFTAALDDEDAFGGGYDIRASTVPVNPIKDLEGALAGAPGVDASAVERVANASIIPLELRQSGVGRDFEPYVVHGLDDAFLGGDRDELAAIADGYASPREVWQALAEQPGLAVVDGFVVPRRDDYGSALAPPDFQLEGFFIEDETFAPIPIEARDPQTGALLRLTVIGVLRDSAPPFLLGVSTAQETLAAALGDRVVPSVHYVALRPGADASAMANALEAAFLTNGMEAERLAEELDEFVGTNRIFNNIMQGFMGLGLIVGVAALGVISARSVVERRQQIGVLRSIGFQPRMVQLAFLLESSFVSILGIVTGTALGLVLSFNIIRDAGTTANWESVRFVVPWLNLGIIFAIVYAASLLATLLPARRASRVYPAEALRYQ
jgi:putative ABC transport system permease protein